MLSAKENKSKDPFIFCHSPHFWAISVRLLCRRSVCATAAWEGGGVKTAVPEDLNFGQPPKIGKMRPQQHRYALIIIDMCFLVACFPTFYSFLVLACEEVEYQCQLRSLKFAEFWTKIYWAKLRWTWLASRSLSLSNRLLSRSRFPVVELLSDHNCGVSSIKSVHGGATSIPINNGWATSAMGYISCIHMHGCSRVWRRLHTCAITRVCIQIYIYIYIYI